MYPAKLINIPIEPINGYAILDRYGRVKNILTRNFARALYGILNDSKVTIYNIENSGHEIDFTAGLFAYPYVIGYYGAEYGLFFGAGNQNETITVYKLNTPKFHVLANYIDTIEDVSFTSILIGTRYVPPSTLTITELGLLLIAGYYSYNAYLMTYKALTEGLDRTYGEEYRDGYEIRFPAEYTKWFIRALAFSMFSYNRRYFYGWGVRDINGNWILLKTDKTFGKISKMVLGSGTKTPSPDDYYLESPIAEITDLSLQIIEDTQNNVCRLKINGTITPDTSIELSEIGITATVSAILPVSGSTNEILIIRKVLDSPMTLSPNITYTITIELLLG